MHGRHPTELGQDGALVGVVLLLRRGALLLLLLLGLGVGVGLGRGHVVLPQVAVVRGARLGLWRDAVGGGLGLGAGLHAGRGAGAGRLGLGPRRGLRRAHLAAQRPARLQVGVGRLGHLLLGAHGAAVLRRGAPAQVLLLLLLLQEPLVEHLLEHGLLWPAAAPLGGTLPWAGLQLWTPRTATAPSIWTLQPRQ